MVLALDRRFVFWSVLAVLGSVAGGALAQAPRQASQASQASQSSPQSRVYPAAKQGGNYMNNYYLPPAPSSTPGARRGT